jgi:hypothetical protein
LGDETGGACSIHGRDEKFISSSETLKGDNLKDPAVDGRIILK